MSYLVFVTGRVEYLSGEVGPITINSWAMGPQYTNSDGTDTYSIGFITPSTVKSSALLDVNGKFLSGQSHNMKCCLLPVLLSLRTMGSLTMPSVTSPEPLILSFRATLVHPYSSLRECICSHWFCVSRRR